jgi:hypothetical protein
MTMKRLFRWPFGAAALAALVSTPAAAQSVRVDIGIRTPQVGARVVYGPAPAYPVAWAVQSGWDVRRADPTFWRRLDDYDRESWLLWREYDRRHWKDVRAAEREWLRWQRERQREFEKWRRAYRREAVKDAREARREWLKWQREYVRDRREADREWGRDRRGFGREDWPREWGRP